MGFPTELPKSAVSNVLKLFGPDKPTNDLVALSVYDLLGYGLYLFFGETRYLMMGSEGFGSDLFKKIERIMSSPEFAELVKSLPEYVPAIVRAIELKAKGVSNWRIGFTLVVEFGPRAVTMVTKLLSLWYKE